MIQSTFKKEKIERILMNKKKVESDYCYYICETSTISV